MTIFGIESIKPERELFVNIGMIRHGKIIKLELVYETLQPKYP